MISGALADFAEYDWNDGVQISELDELDTLCLRTRNSTYEIVVTSPRAEDVLIRGGVRFPTFTRVRLCGSTSGGNLLKRGGIFPGFRLELERDGRRILTSTIISISFQARTTEQ